MPINEIIYPARRLVKAAWVFTKTTLHLPQKREDHFARLAPDPTKSDIEVDGFAKLTPVQLDAVKKGIYGDILPYVSKGKILDFGCGTGRHLLNFPSPPFERNGIDLNEGSLVRAKAKMPDATFAQVNLLANDDFVEKAKASYDLIYSVSVLQYFQPWELQKLFHKFAALLKQSGYVHLIFPIPKNIVDKWADDHYRRYTLDEIEHWLSEAGLTMVLKGLLVGVDYTGRILAKK